MQTVYGKMLHPLSVLELLLLLVLLALNGTEQASVTRHVNLTINGLVEARVQMPAGMVTLKAFAASGNEMILREINQGSKVYKYSSLKWYTPGYLSIEPIASARNASRRLTVSDFFEIHYGVSMRIKLLTEHITQKLANAANNMLFGDNGPKRIKTWQIHIMELQDLHCKSFFDEPNNNAKIGIGFQCGDMIHQPYVLRGYNIHNVDIRNHLNATEKAIVMCNVSFAHMDREVEVTLPQNSFLQILDTTTDLDTKSMEKLVALESIVDKMRLEVTQLQSFLGVSPQNATANCSTVSRDGKSFIIFQQRVDNSVTFERGWSDYENGFGDSHNFWLGLAKISALTITTPRVLRVELERFDGSLKVLHYEQFRVLGPGTKYKMTYSQIRNSKTIIDALRLHKNMAFSTFDNDNDQSSGNCAKEWRSGWWFHDCFEANPNGVYYSKEIPGKKNGIIWSYLDYPVKLYKNLKVVRLMLQVD